MEFSACQSATLNVIAPKINPKATPQPESNAI